MSGARGVWRACSALGTLEVGTGFNEALVVGTGGSGRRGRWWWRRRDDGEAGRRCHLSTCTTRMAQPLHASLHPPRRSGTLIALVSSQNIGHSLPSSASRSPSRGGTRCGDDDVDGVAREHVRPPDIRRARPPSALIRAGTTTQAETQSAEKGGLLIRSCPLCRAV